MKRAQLTPEDDADKNRWRTPLALFRALDLRFRFRLDAAAGPENALCRSFFTEADDGLAKSWRIARTLGGSVWLNPPYSKTALPLFMEKCVKEAQAGATVVALVPATMEVRWMHDFVVGVAAEDWLFNRRLAYRHAVTGEPMGNSNFASQLVVYTPEGAVGGVTRFGGMTREGVPTTAADREYWQERMMRRAA
jgi:site-specific DNA-methyltransferase (adenine-specific)